MIPSILSLAVLQTEPCTDPPPCLISVLMNLRRPILTARKAWRVFMMKLNKLNRSKAIKKHKKKNQLITSTTPTSKLATLMLPFLSFQSRFQLGKRRRRSNHPVKYKPRHPYNQKKSAPVPVYIDELFIEPVILVRNQPLASSAAAAGVGKKSPYVKKKGGKLNDPHQADAAAAGTSKGGGKSHTADDMWESLVLGSPQMHGINERAEEFISRFRAEMQVQENMLRAAGGHFIL